MTSQPPKVSVLVPVYNAAEFLTETIGAVLAQTFVDFELILLDDASTDNSAEIIAKFQDPRIVYAKNQTNLGISATRNKLAKMARGKYIAVLDNDDICLPERLFKQVEFLDNNPDIAIVGSCFELFCNSPHIPKWKSAIINLGWVWCHPQNPNLQDLWHGNVLMHPTAMCRRALFEQHHICYNPDYTPAEDYDLIAQVFFAGLKIANMPDILLRYHLHGHNHSLQTKKQMRLADHAVKEKILPRLTYKPKYFYPYWLVILQKLRLRFLIRKQDV